MMEDHCSRNKDNEQEKTPSETVTETERAVIKNGTVGGASAGTGKILPLALSVIQPLM